MTPIRFSNNIALLAALSIAMIVTINCLSTIENSHFFVSGFSQRSIHPPPAYSYNQNDNDVKKTTVATTDSHEKVSSLFTTPTVTSSRRTMLSQVILGTMTGIVTQSIFFPTQPVYAEGKMFAPGGTLVDYEVGVRAGNPEASPSRRADNSNVVFNQDYYYKFGTAAPWIKAGSIDFPKTMPFAPAQQRYDTMKKYRERVQRGIDLVAGLENAIAKGEYADIPDSTAPEYSIRPFGLMANNFLATENTGTTNELLLARWYINEITLDIDDIKKASSKEEANKSYQAAKSAMNSYLGLLNRVITSKVGDKFDLI